MTTVTDVRRRAGRRASLLPTTPSTIAAFLRMDVVEEISYPATFAMTLLKTVVPLFLYYFIGQLVSDARVGGDYLTFVTIGLAVSAILQGAMAGFGGSLQRGFMRGYLETLLVEPVPWTFLPIAMNLWQMILALFTGAVIMVLGLFLGANFLVEGLPEATLLIVLGVLACTAIGVLSASVLMLTLKSQPILIVYTLAASILAGSVFSVSQLPPLLRAVSYLIPHTYVINGIRTVLTDDPGSFHVSMGEAVIALVAFNVVVFPLGVWAFRRSLEFARRMGLLSGY